MAETKIRTEQPPLVLRTRPALEMDDEQLFEFCRINREWRIECTAVGELEIMPPTGGETSDENAEITMQLRLWAKPEHVSGDPVLPGFVLDLKPIWEPGF